MALMKGTKIIKSHYTFKTFTTYPGSQKYQLSLENMMNSENIDRHDTVLKELVEYYPKSREICR